MLAKEKNPEKESHLKRFLSSTSTSLRAAGRPLFRRTRSKNSRKSEGIEPTATVGMSLDSNLPFDSAARAGLSEAAQHPQDTNFDIFEWYPRYQSCQRYFLDHAQHSMPVQALASFLNIHLPFQRHPNPVWSSSAESGIPEGSRPLTSGPPGVSLIPYVRRLVATGMDFPGVLHGFFGDDWAVGVGSLHEQERHNFFFAAKSGGWASVKRDYDILPLETVPFLRPLQGPAGAEIEAAEKSWSEWLAMEDWMIGPRHPDILRDSSSQAYSRHSRSPK